MKLYYCLTCGAVCAFDVSDITKHGLSKPEETDCLVCGMPAPAYLLLELDVREAKDA